MSKNSDISSEQIIYDSIRRIALHKYVNKSTGAFRNTERKTGYVAKVHTDEKDELYGTIDVQEFNVTQIKDDGLDGYHEGVMLSSIQDNSNGMVVIPMLYSEVVIAMDPVSMREYVTLFSHVDTIRMDSHQGVIVGVTETDKFDESDDSDSAPDFDKLKKTGVHAHTTYASNTMTSVAVGKKKQSSQLISDEKIEQIHDKATVVLDDNQALQKFDSNSVVVNKDHIAAISNNVFLGSDSATQHAVLGEKLAELLMDILSALSQTETMTQIGKQPFINKAQFISLKAKVTAYKSAVSGFLSKTVKVKE